MADPFIGEIRMVGFNFAPRGFAFCDGQMLSISQNTALFSLLGTTYGGDGQTTFALPNLRDRTPMHQGRADAGAIHPLGEMGGEDFHTLTLAEASHAHAVRASVNQASTNVPDGNVLAAKRRGGKDIFSPNANTALHPSSTSTQAPAGGGLPHENRQPFLTINFVICLEGIYPSRN